MSVEEIKIGIAKLSLQQQQEISADLFHLRHVSDAEYQEGVRSRLVDADASHWLTSEEFERRLADK
jgi:hypothetical protein